ncbi:MAG: esterase family protein [Bacteroidetes bacterium]|nr:esterase family protein [Bacteroidota bacterium]
MTPFRTVEISDPSFEKEPLRFITVKSKNLKGRGDICLFVPPDIEKFSEIPLVILLHGVYGSSWSWAFSGGVHQTALCMMNAGIIPPMLIAMPSDGLWGDGSGYVAHDGFDFEKWIAEEVPAAVKINYPGISHFSKLFIGGLSMGGFGALKIGINYAEIFSAVSAHSSLTNLEQMKLFVEEDISHYKQTDPSEEDILQTILKNQLHLPDIRFDCGNADPLIEENRLLHHQLLKHNIDHQYKENEGKHEWPYWQLHVRATLAFFASKC